MSLLSYIISKLLEAYSTQAQVLALTQTGRQAGHSEISNDLLKVDVWLIQVS